MALIENFDEIAKNFIEPNHSTEFIEKQSDNNFIETDSIESNESEITDSSGMDVVVLDEEILEEEGA